MALKGTAIFIVGALFTAAVTPFITKFGEQMGWYEDPQGTVQSFGGQFLDGALWLSRQWWYTHGSVALVALATGLALGYWTRGRQQAASPAEEPLREELPNGLVLKGSIDRTIEALDEVLNWADLGVAAIADYEKSAAEWKSMSIVFDRFGLPLPERRGSAEAMAKERKAFLERLYPLVRDGHIQEAKDEAAAYVNRPDIFS